jgi:hypothetical protein
MSFDSSWKIKTHLREFHDGNVIRVEFTRDGSHHCPLANRQNVKSVAQRFQGLDCAHQIVAAASSERGKCALG